MTATPNRLYDLLPVMYRQRDAPQYELEQFFAALQVGFDLAVGQTETLYEDLFIATCGEARLPFIAALLGISDQRDHALSTNRLAIANALAARQRKGTLAAVEMVTGDVSGWRVVARDMGRLLGVTQDVERVRPDRGRYVDVADEGQLDLIGGAADEIARRPSIAPGAEFGPTTVGLFVYAHEWYALDRAQLNQRADGEYFFSPFGLDLPIRLKSGQAPDDAVAPPELMGVPVVQRSPTAVQPVVGRIHVEGRPADLPLGDIVQFDLGDWQRPPGPSPAAYVDLERGRLTLAPRVAPQRNPRIFADFYYRFGADIGGGPYRPVSLGPDDGRHVGRRHVARAWAGQAPAGVRPEEQDTRTHFSDIGAALARPRDPVTTVTIDDNARYEIDTLVVEIGPHGHVTIEGGAGVRPTLVGDIVVTGDFGAGFSLIGVCLAGRIIGRQLATISVQDCTISPGSPDPAIDASDLTSSGSIQIVRSIVGRVDAAASTITTTDSIIDDQSPAGQDSDNDKPSTTRPGAVVCGRLETECSTFLGAVHAVALHAESSLFVENVVIGQAESSSAHASYFAANQYVDWPVSDMPLMHGGGIDLISRTFGDTRYGQIAWTEREPLLSGGRDASEVGAYNSARRAPRMRSLRSQAADYVPFGFDIDVRVLETGASTVRSDAP